MVKAKPAAPGQKKLISLGVTLPALPVCSAPDLPKQSELSELRYKVAKGVQPYSELERKEKILTEMWIRHQERLGLDVMVDGEMDRGDMVSFFAKKINGFELGGTVRCYGNRYYRKPIIKSKLSWREAATIEHWRLFQRMTHKPLKAVVTGPLTLLEYSFNEYYPSRESALSDLTMIVRKEVVGLSEAGAKIIQIEEPALSARPDEIGMAVDAINEVTRGIKAYVILQHAFGNLEPIWAKMQKLSVDNFGVEANGALPSLMTMLKKNPSGKDISVGLVSAHDTAVETVQDLRKQIRDLKKAVPASQLWITAQGGLKTRTADQAMAKLRSLADATLKERGKS